MNLAQLPKYSWTSEYMMASSLNEMLNTCSECSCRETFPFLLLLLLRFQCPSPPSHVFFLSTKIKQRDAWPDQHKKDRQTKSKHHHQQYLAKEQAQRCLLCLGCSALVATKVAMFQSVSGTIVSDFPIVELHIVGLAIPHLLCNDGCLNGPG